TDVAQVLPPLVAITHPTPSGLRVTEPKLLVKATAQSVGQHAVISLQLLLDGRPYEGQRGLRSVTGGRLGKVEKEWTVELPPGTHRLAVTARSAVSLAPSEAIEVTYTPSRPPDPKDLRPSLHVLTIGINAYPGNLKL